MMVFKRGEIWIANLNPVKRVNEIGKTRPVLIFQNDELNSGNYPTTITIPLTSDLIDDAEPLRFRVKSRESLEKDSDLLLGNIRAIDNSRLIEKVAKLTDSEMRYIKELLDEVLL